METTAALGFEEYVRSRGNVLLNSARRLTSNAADAQDLLQTALARTFPVWSSIADKRHADAYVRRVLINTRTSLWRARKLDEYATDQLPETAVDDGSEERALRSMMMDAMQVLSRQQRSVVVLRYYESLSTAETACALGVSLGTVKSTLHRALARLRDELERQGYRGRSSIVDELELGDAVPEQRAGASRRHPAAAAVPAAGAAAGTGQRPVRLADGHSQYGGRAAVESFEGRNAA